MANSMEANALNRPHIIEWLDQAIEKGGMKVSIAPIGKKRSLDANALQAVFIKQIAEHFGHDVKTVRDEIKRDFGLPILLAAQDERAEMIAWTLHKIGYHDMMTPRQQLKVMGMFAVTSIMTTAEHRQMLTSVQTFYREHGLILESNRVIR